MPTVRTSLVLFLSSARHALITAAIGLTPVGALAGSPDPQFRAAFDVIPLPEMSRSVAIGDWDEDGRDDFALVGASSIEVFVNRDGHPVPAGSHPVAISLPDSPWCRFMASGDLNGDGHLDLVLNDHFVAGDGSGGFGSPQMLDTGPSPGSIAVADLDLDGHLDMVVCNETYGGIADSISVLMGEGNGLFSKRRALWAAENGSVSVAVGDLNHDGYPDIVTGNEGSIFLPGYGSVSVFMNSSGVFTEARQILQITDGSVNAVVLIDANRDGHPDVLFSDAIVSLIRIMTGSGDGEFSSPAILANTASTSITMEDLDSDGIEDLVATTGSGFMVAQGHEDGTVSNERIVWTTPYTAMLAVGDFDDDGNKDVLVVPNRAPFEAELTIAALHYGHGDMSFGREIRSPAPINQIGLVVHDFDGDGVSDFVTANSQSLAYQRGVGDGSVAEPKVFFQPSGYGPIKSIAGGEVDGDGLMDIAVFKGGENDIGCHCWLPGMVHVLRGEAGATFGAPQTYEVSGVYSDFTVQVDILLGDFDGDARSDLLLGRTESDTVSVWINDGFGVLTARSPLVCEGPVAVADLNADDRSDVIGQYRDGAGHSFLRVYIASGSGMFDSPIDSPLSASPKVVAVSDLNGDGSLDLGVVAWGSSPSLHVLHGLGDGRFTHAGVFDGGEPDGVAISDVTQDGWPDIVTVNPDRATIAVLAGSNGTLASKREFGAGEWPGLLAIVDMNGDAAMDVVVRNYSTRTWTTLVNEQHATPALLSTASIEFRNNAVHVRWLAGIEFSGAAVSRRAGHGSWRQVGEAIHRGDGALEYDDADVVAAATYEYRLTLTTPRGMIESDVVTLTVPGATELAIGAVPGYSADGSWVFRITLPEAGAVRAELFDVAGRMVASASREFSESGVQEIRLTPHSPIRSGLLLARVRQGARTASAKIVVAR